MKYTKAQYKRAFEIACDLLNSSNIYGIDADILFGLIMQEYGIVSTFEYQKFILEHLDRFDDDDEVRMNAIRKYNFECDSFKGCLNCKYENCPIPEEPCYSCIHGLCNENINRTEKWEAKE